MDRDLASTSGFPSLSCGPSAVSLQIQDDESRAQRFEENGYSYHVIGSDPVHPSSQSVSCFRQHEIPSSSEMWQQPTSSLSLDPWSACQENLLGESISSSLSNNRSLSLLCVKSSSADGKENEAVQPSTSLVSQPVSGCTLYENQIMLHPLPGRGMDLPPSKRFRSFATLSACGVENSLLGISECQISSPSALNKTSSQSSPRSLVDESDLMSHSIDQSVSLRSCVLENESEERGSSNQNEVCGVFSAPENLSSLESISVACNQCSTSEIESSSVPLSASSDGFSVAPTQPVEVHSGGHNPILLSVASGQEVRETRDFDDDEDDMAVLGNPVEEGEGPERGVLYDFPYINYSVPEVDGDVFNDHVSCHSRFYGRRKTVSFDPSDDFVSEEEEKSDSDVVEQFPVERLNDHLLACVLR